MKKYPFKFLDPYGSKDKDIFFGRDEEINELYEMVFQSSVVLVYGASGTGKTSLINCGLAGKFQPHDWLSLMIRRGIDINESLEKALNDAGGDKETVQIAAVWHDEWSNEPEISIIESAVARSIKAVYDKSFRPVYLIFDQFEELFILGSGKEQERFIETVQEILQSKQPVKLIFCIREEYLGCLFDFERAVPQLLRKKTRIEPMNLQKIRQVIVGATRSESSNVHLKSGETDLIAEVIFNKIKGDKKTLTIELPYLQVFLDKFYIDITKDETRQKEAVFTINKLNTIGDIGDVLRNFLEDQVINISKNLSVQYPDLSIETAWKILSPLVTLEGTKEPISKLNLYERLPDLDNLMIDATVEAFINSRILRYAIETDMYEIAHDSLAKRIAEKRTDDEIAVLEIKRLVRNQTALKVSARELFSEKQLNFIDGFLKKIKFSDQERALIQESQEAVATQKENERERQASEKRILLDRQKILEKSQRNKNLFTGWMIAALVLTFGLAVWAFYQKQDANRQKNIAKNALEKIEEFQKKSIGKKYMGGIVFYSDSARKHGLIAAEIDLSGGSIYKWDSAKTVCKNYSVVEGDSIYRNWFLPSKDTLALLYYFKSYVGGLANDWYWSSTEGSNYGSTAWGQHFGGGGQYETGKDISYRVRLVRAF